MVNIFLSASIPLKERRKEYYESMDVVAIREAVKALARVVIPRAHLIWGGHPSITPLIRDIMLRVEGSRDRLKEHVTLYQSEFYRDYFPPDNFDFEDVRVIPVQGDQKESEQAMPEEMLWKKDFAAGVFIGGMEGVEEEFRAFRAAYPFARVLPVASTGAAARILFDKMRDAPPEERPDVRLLTDYAYMSLFRDLLGGLLS